MAQVTSGKIVPLIGWDTRTIDWTGLRVVTKKKKILEIFKLIVWNSEIFSNYVEFVFFNDRDSFKYVNNDFKIYNGKPRRRRPSNKIIRHTLG